MQDNDNDILDDLDEWAGDTIIEKSTKSIKQSKKVAKQTPEEIMLNHCQISVPIYNENGHIVGEYGKDLKEATEEELVFWARYCCPTIELSVLKDTAKKACEKNFKDKFFDTVISRHQHDYKLLKFGSSEIYPDNKSKQ